MIVDLGTVSEAAEVNSDFLISFSHSKLTGVILIIGGERSTRTKGDTCKYSTQEEFPQQSDVDYLPQVSQKLKKKTPVPR